MFHTTITTITCTTYTYTFDATGNKQRILGPTGDRTTYSWNVDNRLTKVALPDATITTSPTAYGPNDRTPAESCGSSMTVRNT